MSYFFQFVDDPQLGVGPLAALRDPQLERAAVLTRAALEVRMGIRDKTAEPPQGKPGQCVASSLVGDPLAFDSVCP